MSLYSNPQVAAAARAAAAEATMTTTAGIIQRGDVQARKNTDIVKGSTAWKTLKRRIVYDTDPHVINYMKMGLNLP
jgi:hypothetical protein